ncbi:uncharacterized protein [Nothobranchius furzeri]|nr:uncharacterized protein LOC129157450 [Nothobranchius furzeri]XP_054592659.1 uncharacterized protein LOC129157450 [Nothobranchius furzeri]XP_054592661.1 uncharacterized protein LOC129157457 [Nothobranchius furzeri]XP_054592662.1 uncharacterized protein LOC129157457 [Nothobranchius furzeri]
MNLLRNVFRSSGGLDGWTVVYPPQWKQQDSVNCGVLVCSAVENVVKHRESMTEALTVNQCRTLRLHHATQMLENVNPEDFPPTMQEMLAIKQKEVKLQGTEIKDTDSSIHCLSWRIRTCLFQRATGKNSVFHEHIKKYKWVQCTACKSWLHFECAGVTGDWASKDFFCGCSIHVDVKKIMEGVYADDILTDSEIKDLERNLQTGHILSNRMYLWKHKGFDPSLRKHYSEHVTVFDDMTTETIIQRLERVLSRSGNTSVDPHFITDVVLPEALIQWLQTTNVICRFQAEDLLMKTKPFIDNEGKAELVINDDTPKESSILADTLAAAEWVKGTLFEGMVKVPSVLSMDEEEQQEVLEAVRSWNEDHDYESPAEHLTFAFENKKDYDKFCSFIIDEKNLKVFSRFEVQD